MNAARSFLLSCMIASTVGFAAFATAYADEYVQSNALRIITPYSGAWTSAPTLAATAQTTDAPLLGNGDVGVAITGTIDSMSFCLGKNEWWSLTQGKTQPLGRVVVSMPKMKGSSYSMQQVLKYAECSGSFSVGRRNLGLQSWMSATKNVLVTRLVLTGDSAIAVMVRLTDGFGALDQSKVTASGGVTCLDVTASDNVDAYKGYPTRKGRLAARVRRGREAAVEGTREAGIDACVASVD